MAHTSAKRHQINKTTPTQQRHENQWKDRKVIKIVLWCQYFPSSPERRKWLTVFHKSTFLGAIHGFDFTSGGSPPPPGWSLIQSP